MCVVARDVAFFKLHILLHVIAVNNIKSDYVFTHIIRVLFVKFFLLSSLPPGVEPQLQVENFHNLTKLEISLSEMFENG